jgi:hypothetical protein
MLKEGVVWFGETLTKSVTLRSTAAVPAVIEKTAAPAGPARETRQKRHK